MTRESEAQISQGIPQSSKSERTQSAAFREVLNQFSKLEIPEEKIGLLLEFMRGALADKTPKLKDYWEAKRICLPLFKEDLKPQVRSHLWEDYIRISAEVRHLKEILNEQAAFVVEQIELAIQSTEIDLEKYDSLLNASASVCFSEECFLLKTKQDFYASIQQELNLLNILAARVNSLRREAIRTGMRSREKNQFLERLSQMGDKIFPRRKELIKKISQEFLDDVLIFINKTLLPENLKHASIFHLREEVKTLQSLAKELTLDTRTFTQTRLSLSKLWDLLVEQSKERKKDFNEKKEFFQKNFDLCLGKIKLLAQKCQTSDYTMEEAMKLSHEILNFMKTVTLGKEDIRLLKDEIIKARLPLYDQINKEQELRKQELETIQNQRLHKIEDFKQRIHLVLQKVSEHPIEKLSEIREELHKQLLLLPVSQAEKELLDYSLKELRDQILDKKEKALSLLSDQQIQSLQDLKTLLEEWRRQKQETRTQLDNYRKALSKSGYDFEKAMLYRQLQDEEKARLAKINHTIEDIEEKIYKLENS